ncbi:MAG: DUF1080 domain-containing protein, partial [Tepidisphaeraceae bacterium]
NDMISCTQMRKYQPLSLILTLLFVTPASLRAEERGFVPLFNGKDLSGWVAINVAPDTFSARDGMIASTGFPTGIMRTERQYENFIIEFEWMHLKPKGNAGLFVWGAPMTAPGTPFARGIEVQVLDDAYVEAGARQRGIYTGHGDIFSIHGATMKPDRPHPDGWERCLPRENRANPAGQWNHYRVEANDGVIKLAVNGKVVSGGTACSPRKGYLCLESEGSPALFKNIRIKELPSTNPKPDEIQPEAEGFRTIYNGVNLAGWKREPGQEGHWAAQDWVLNYDGKGESAGDKHLWTEESFSDFEMIVDWRLSGEPEKKKWPVILPSGDEAKNEDESVKEIEVDDAGDSGLFLRGSTKAHVNIFCWPVGSGEVWSYRADPAQPAEVRAACTPRARADKPIGQWNRFHITMKGDRLTVVLNDQTVIENAQLPGVPARGPIGLQHEDGSIQFSNLFIKELK